MKLFMYLVPLVLITGFAATFLSPKNTSNWGYMSKYSSLWSSSRSAVTAPPSDFSSSDEGVVDLRSTVLMVGVDQNKEEAVSVDYVLNVSSSPPLDVGQLVLLQPNGTNMGDSLINPSTGGLINKNNVSDSFNVLASTGFNNSNSYKNESGIPVVKAARRRSSEYSKLERIEAGLIRARTAIREAKFSGNQTQDPENVPIGPMYWNANSFHRSYLEMEKQFKIFVYEEGEPPLFHNGPCKSIYSTEGNFIHAIEMNNQFRTRDPERALVYFLPFSVAMLVRFVYVRDSHDFGPIKQTLIDYINVVGGKYPFWNRSLGADHFMLSCHDWGPEASRSLSYLHRNSIRVLCNANTSEGFNPSKDVSFPEINLQTGTISGFVGGPSPSHRPTLAFFAGGLHGPIRPILLEHWENKDEDIKVQKYLPRGVSYYDMMRKSKYCICPSGYEVASPRIVEAIYTGCVPVLVSDHYVPPYSDVLNWKSFSVEVSVSDIPNLKSILMSISPRQYIRTYRRVVSVRRHFEVHSPPKRYDVFHMILHSVWLRRLNVRIHDNDQ